MDYETLYTLYESRKTLLKILASRGYDTTPYEKFGPVEIAAMAAAGPLAFSMDLVKKGDTPPAFGNSMPECKVLYSLGKIKNRLGTFLLSLTQDEEGNVVDNSKTEFIVILLEPVADAFHTAALSTYLNQNKMRVSFFQAHSLVNNPLEHVLVPKHELVPAEEKAALLASLKVKSITGMPRITFHEDMIGRLMSLIPGDIVKITRGSPSAGEYVYYRVCMPKV